MSECKNRYCLGGVEVITCCSGHECGCMGMPVAAKWCPECNPEKIYPTDKQIIEQIGWLEWLDD